MSDMTERIVCRGDVVKTFVDPTVKYVHAVKGIDHGPLPIEVPTPRSEQGIASPRRAGEAPIPSPRLAPPTAPRTKPFPGEGATT